MKCFILKISALLSVALTVTFFSCSKNAPTQSSGGSIEMKTTDNLQGAKFVLAGGQANDTTSITGASQAIAFAGLAAGNYQLTVIMPDGRKFTDSVTVSESQTNYLGTITKVDYAETTSAGIAYPGEPTYPYPLPQSDFIAWHYPAAGETITVYNYRSADTAIYYTPNTVGSNGTVSSSATVRMADWRPYVYVSVQFKKPMDRQSVLDAFSISPDVQGTASTYYWNNYFFPVEPMPMDSGYYTLKFDNTQSVQVQTGTGTAIMPAGTPSMMPPVQVLSNYATSFEFYFPVDSTMTDTTYTVTFSTAAKDSSGQHVQQAYSFSFYVKTQVCSIYIPTPPPHETPPQPSPTCVCSMIFSMSTVQVLTKNGLPVESLDISLFDKRSGEQIKTNDRQAGVGTYGTYTVIDDGSTGYLGTLGDTLLFTGKEGADSCSGTFVFSTDSCYCHIHKISGPDTLWLGN